MLPRRIAPLFAMVLAVSVLCPLPQARSQDVAEAVRKAKEKKQQQQTQADNSPAKPKKTYTNEDIPESKSGSAKPDSAPTKEDSASVTLSLPKSTSARPGGTNVLWSVHNTSDHFINFTMMLIVTGPCGFHSEHPLRFSLNPGGRAGVGNGAFGTAFYQENCPGEYTFELRAMSYSKLLDSATATITVL